MWKTVVVAFVVLQCGGCAFTAQSVKISPEVKATATVSGAGKAVQLVVSDERPSKVVGQRGVGGVGADITIDGDLQTIIADAIVSGLQKHDFVAGNQRPAGTGKLTVEIRNLSTKNIMGFWSGTLRDEMSLKGICHGANGAEYEKMYNGLFETSIQVVPSGEANNRYVSATVSDAVNQLVNDDALLGCLRS